MDNLISEANIYLILKIIVIFGALNWGLIAVDKKYNIITNEKSTITKKNCSKYYKTKIY